MLLLFIVICMQAMHACTYYACIYNYVIVYHCVDWMEETFIKWCYSKISLYQENFKFCDSYSICNHNFNWLCFSVNTMF